MSGAGLIVALPEESRSLGLRLTRGNDPVRVGGASVLVGGAGPDNARRAAERLLEAGADGLISWGCAAALHPSLRPGALLLPGRIIGCDGAALEADRDWHRRLGAALAAAKISYGSGDLAESRSIVATVENKRALATRSGAHAVDMESAAVARAARAANKPFVAIRAVADPAEMAVPSTVLHAMNADGKVDLRRLLLALCARPGELPALIRLGMHFSAALAALRGVHGVAPDFLLPAPAQ